MLIKDESVSIKDKIIRFFVAIFLFILVAMMVVTLMPGDLEKGFVSILSGSNSSEAGLVGEMPIQMDYFHAARKDCYYRYKQYMPTQAENAETINSCAYQLAQNLKIASLMASEVGYTISEKSVKKDLSDQAREIYRNSVSAGYSKSELTPPEEIYTSLLRAAPMRYRIDTYTATGLFEKFLSTTLKKPDSQREMENEAENAVVSLNFVVFKDSAILEKMEHEITIPEEMVKKEYEESKDKEPYEKKRDFLLKKIKAKEKQKKFQELKDKMKLAIATPGNLAQVAQMAGSNIIPVSFQLAKDDSIYVAGNHINLSGNQDFWKDLTGKKFGEKNAAGPYSFSDVTAFVEFNSFTAKPGLQIKNDDGENLVYEVFNEIVQSITESHPIKRNLTGQANAN